MNESQVKKLLDFYGIRPQKIFPIQKGYRNRSFHIIGSSGTHQNLMVFKREPDILSRINRADSLSEHLYQKSLPTRTRTHPKTLTIKTRGGTTYARIYNYLPGSTISWEAYSKKHIKLLGQAMSDIHLHSADFSGNLPKATDEFIALNSRMQNYFTGPNVASALRQKLGLRISPEIFLDFKNYLLLTSKPPSQPLHLDLVRGNILFNEVENTQSAPASRPGRSLLGNRLSPEMLGCHWKIDNLILSGIIDFEKAALGHPVLDLARTYAFLLVDCANKTPDQIYKYLVYSGYNKRGHNHYDKNQKIHGIHLCKIFKNLIKFFLVHDFYKFLRHNPYESLTANHHFIRTRNILLDKYIIHIINPK